MDGWRVVVPLCMQAVSSLPPPSQACSQLAQLIPTNSHCALTQHTTQNKQLYHSITSIVLPPSVPPPSVFELLFDDCLICSGCLVVTSHVRGLLPPRLPLAQPCRYFVISHRHVVLTKISIGRGTVILRLVCHPCSSFLLSELMIEYAARRVE